MDKRTVMVKNCAFCGVEFETTYKQKIYCTKRHALSATDKRYHHRLYAARDFTVKWHFNMLEVPDPPPLRTKKAKSEPAYYKKAPRETSEGYAPDIKVPIGLEKEFRYLTEDQT